MTKTQTQENPEAATFKGAPGEASPLGTSAGALYTGDSNYYKAEDLDGGPVNLVISEVEVSDAFDKQALVLSFKDNDRKLRLNKTNAETLIKRAGDDYSKWVGRKIMIAAVPVTYKGKTVGGVRVL